MKCDNCGKDLLIDGQELFIITKGIYTEINGIMDIPIYNFCTLYCLFHYDWM